MRLFIRSRSGDPRFSFRRWEYEGRHVAASFLIGRAVATGRRYGQIWLLLGARRAFDLQWGQPHE